MKKKIGIFFMAAMLLLSLAGCSCSHEWEEASCVAPKTCAKCGEAEGEPLGHDWAASGCETPATCSRCGQSGNDIPGHDWIAATCEAPETCARCAESRDDALGHDWAAASCETPETCSRCGNTQGEAAGHAFGKWAIAESTMTRTCSVCAAEETSEYSEEAYAQQLIQGHWDFLVVFQDGSPTDPYRRQDPYVAYSATAGADGSFQLRVGQDKEFALRWEYLSYDPENDIYTYKMIREDNQGELRAYIQPLKDGIENGMVQMLLPFAEGVQIFLFQDPRLMEGFVGTWKGTGDNGDSVLKLAADHTFTGDVAGQVSGTWYLRPLKKSFDERYYYIGITFRGTRGEAPFEHFIMLMFWSDPTERGVAEEIKNTPYFSIAVEEGQDKIDFRWREE